MSGLTYEEKFSIAVLLDGRAIGKILKDEPSGEYYYLPKGAHQRHRGDLHTTVHAVKLSLEGC